MAFRKPIIGVMGGATGDQKTLAAAYELGKLIASNKWILLCGGRRAGIMDMSAKGAKEAGGLVVGILPGKDTSDASDYLDIALPTGIGAARNNINALCSDAVIACTGGAGTLSEIALALKAGKKVVLLDFDIGTSFDRYISDGMLIVADTPENAIACVKAILATK